MPTDQPPSSPSSLGEGDRGSSSGADPSIEERLVALERASEQRSATLRALAEAVPPAVSRRALLVGAANDLRSAPNRAEIARRGLRKVVWAPLSLARRVKRRVTGAGAPR